MHAAYSFATERLRRPSTPQLLPSRAASNSCVSCKRKMPRGTAGLLRSRNLLIRLSDAVFNDPQPAQPVRPSHRDSDPALLRARTCRRRRGSKGGHQGSPHPFEASRRLSDAESPRDDGGPGGEQPADRLHYAGPRHPRHFGRWHPHSIGVSSFQPLLFYVSGRLLRHCPMDHIADNDNCTCSLDVTPSGRFGYLASHFQRLVKMENVTGDHLSHVIVQLIENNNTLQVRANVSKSFASVVQAGWYATARGRFTCVCPCPGSTLSCHHHRQTCQTSSMMTMTLLLRPSSCPCRDPLLPRQRRHCCHCR